MNDNRSNSSYVLTGAVAANSSTGKFKRSRFVITGAAIALAVGIAAFAFHPLQGSAVSRSIVDDSSRAQTIPTEAKPQAAKPEPNPLEFVVKRPLSIKVQNGIIGLQVGTKVTKQPDGTFRDSLGHQLSLNDDQIKPAGIASAR